MIPPTRGVHVPEEDNAASSKPNSVFDVPISRDSRLLRGPRMYVALETKIRFGNGHKGEIENALMAPDAERARTQQGERPNQPRLPFRFPLMLPQVRLLGLDCVLA